MLGKGSEGRVIMLFHFQKRTKNTLGVRVRYQKEVFQWSFSMFYVYVSEFDNLHINYYPYVFSYGFHVLAFTFFRGLSY